MLDLQQFQKDVWQNKLAHDFNTTDVYKEFCYTFSELNEALDSYRKKLSAVGEELADVTIYLLGLAEMLGVNLEEELIKKHEKNKKREYRTINGVLTRTKEAL